MPAGVHLCAGDTAVTPFESHSGHVAYVTYARHLLRPPLQFTGQKAEARRPERSVVSGSRVSAGEAALGSLPVLTYLSSLLEGELWEAGDCPLGPFSASPELTHPSSFPLVQGANLSVVSLTLDISTWRPAFPRDLRSLVYWQFHKPSLSYLIRR